MRMKEKALKISPTSNHVCANHHTLRVFRATPTDKHLNIASALTVCAWMEIGASVKMYFVSQSLFPSRIEIIIDSMLTGFALRFFFRFNCALGCFVYFRACSRFMSPCSFASECFARIQGHNARCCCLLFFLLLI